jgi:hypothetical protein
VFRTDRDPSSTPPPNGSRSPFEVDAIDEATRTGWSVVVRGTLARITHLTRLRTLPWAPGRKTWYVRVRPLTVTGRRSKLLDELPVTWWGRQDSVRSYRSSHDD